MTIKNIIASTAASAVISHASAATFVTSAGASASGGALDNIYTHFKSISSDDVVSLGVFVPTGAFGGDTLLVSLWTANGLVASTSISSGTPVGGFVYGSIAPVALVSGQSYALTVTGHVSTQIADRFAGTDTAASFNTGLQNTADGLYDGTHSGGLGNPFPTLAGFNFSPNRHTIASFETVSAVPEPETYAMLAGLGLVGFGLYRRCRK